MDADSSRWAFAPAMVALCVVFFSKRTRAKVCNTAQRSGAESRPFEAQEIAIPPSSRFDSPLQHVLRILDQVHRSLRAKGCTEDAVRLVEASELLRQHALHSPSGAPEQSTKLPSVGGRLCDQHPNPRDSSVGAFDPAHDADRSLSVIVPGTPKKVSQLAPPWSMVTSSPPLTPLGGSAQSTRGERELIELLEYGLSHWQLDLWRVHELSVGGFEHTKHASAYSD